MFGYVRDLDAPERLHPGESGPVVDELTLVLTSTDPQPVDLLADAIGI